MARTCGICKHGGPALSGMTLAQRTCRIRAPAVLFVGAHLQTTFPVVVDAWSCGEFKHRSWWRRLLARLAI